MESVSPAAPPGKFPAPAPVRPTGPPEATAPPGTSFGTGFVPFPGPVCPKASGMIASCAAIRAEAIHLRKRVSILVPWDAAQAGVDRSGRRNGEPVLARRKVGELDAVGCKRGQTV